MEPLMMSRAEVQRHLGICLATTTNWIRQGKLPSVKIGGRRLIPASAVRKLEQDAMASAKVGE